MDFAHRVGHKDANMIVNVYAHLVEEMRKKEAYKLPKVSFSATSEEPIVAKDCCQNEKGRQGVAANNFISFNINGRGDRI